MFSGISHSMSLEELFNTLGKAKTPPGREPEVSLVCVHMRTERRTTRRTTMGVTTGRKFPVDF